MARVKGTILMPYVKSIRSDKTGRFDKYLTEEDKKIVSSQILASSWYPLETHFNCMMALTKEIAKDNMQMVRDWSHSFVDSSYMQVYKNLFSETDPRKAIKGHQLMFKTLFDSIEMDLEEVSDKEYIGTYKGADPLLEPFYYSAVGIIERSLERSGAKGINIQFLSKSWEGDPETKIKISWAQWIPPKKPS